MPIMKAENKKTMKCLICNLPAVGWTGYIFYSNGKIRVGVPLCDNHLRKLGWEIANPIFENSKALELFRSTSPRVYKKSVEGKKIIILSIKDSRKIHDSNSLTNSNIYPPTHMKHELKRVNEKRAEKRAIVVSPNNFVLTKTGFKKVCELSSSNIILGVKEPTKELEWGFIKLSEGKDRMSSVTVMTDKNEITLGCEERFRIIRDEKEILVKAEKVVLGDLMEIKFLDKQPIRKELIENFSLNSQPKPLGHDGFFLNEDIAYLLGVFNNIVDGLPRNLTLKIWGANLEEMRYYGERIQETICRVNSYVHECTGIELETPTHFEVEEGPRFSWLIFKFPEKLPDYFEILQEFARHGEVPYDFRTSGFKIMREFITGILDTGIEFDEKWETFRIVLPAYKNETLRLIHNYFNFFNVHSIVKEVFSPNDPWEIYIYLDVNEVVKKCELVSRRLLTEAACDMEPGEYHKRVTLYPRVRSTISKFDKLYEITFDPLWNPIIEWTTVYPRL